jgi:protein-S-isoprenylcysteine O-methyltransferase Ste14
MLRGGFLLSLYLVSLTFILFASAGRIDWPVGWACLSIYIVISIIYFLLVDPELVRERSHMRSGVKRRDMILASLSFLFFFPVTLLIAGLDAGRFGWSPPLGIIVQSIALFGFTLGNIVGSWAIVSNKFFSTFLRIQEDRGHYVVNKGPYRYVRHSGYAGTIVSSIALPFALGSL